MKHRSVLIPAIMALACLANGADAKVFEGKFTVTYFTGPNHSETGSNCVIFTHTGTILGFPESGTWKTLTPNEGGNFVVDKGILRFYGTYNGGLYIENHYAPVPDKGTTGWFDVWNAGIPPLTALRDGTISMNKNCAGG